MNLLDPSFNPDWQKPGYFYIQIPLAKFQPQPHQELGKLYLRCLLRQGKARVGNSLGCTN